MKQELWFWPSSEEVNDFPDPVAFDAEWKNWRADLAEGPAKEAEIFAREYIQNSWDTIQAEFQTRRKSNKNTPKGSLAFTFVELKGKDAARFRSGFGLDEFRTRYLNMSDKNRKDARLGESVVAQSDDLRSIQLLICSEAGGGGMWGHWTTGGSAAKKGSRLRYALIQTASEKSEAGSGGSWGHGKKAIANASRARVLGVYTCHEEKAEQFDRPGVSRRFIGVAYWRRHEANEREHVGLGVLGKLEQSGQGAWQQFEPLENEHADAFVQSLAIPEFCPRNPAEPLERGTTYLIVEPSFEPSDLISAIERNWWPLVVQHKLPISVTDYQGNLVLPEPTKRPELIPFIDAFQSATGTGSSRHTTESLRHGVLDVGNLALFADTSEEGFSYRTDLEDNTSLTALVRNDMVIAYLPSPRKQAGRPPFLRGAFNVDRERNAEASDLLKMAEPHLHNEWRTQRDGSTDKDAAALAKDVLNRIDRAVKRVREEHSKPQEQRDLHFDVFASILAGKEKARKQTKEGEVEPQVPREFKIHDVSRALVDADPKDPTQISISATARISLSSAALRIHGISKARVLIQLSWKVLEEGSAGTTDARLLNHDHDVWPPGFVVDKPGTAIGVMSALPQSFSWRTAYFPDDWQALPFPRIELLEVLESLNDVGSVEQ